MPIYRQPSSTPTYPIGGAASCISERIHTLARRNQLMPIDPHVEIFMALATGAAWLMMKAGLAKNALELKRRRVTCPSCGKSPCSCTNAA
jgi:formate dehydrogenase maturation protein FdhE